MDSLFYFSFLKERNSQRTIFWNTKILKKVPGTAHYYNLTPCFRYYPINVCKAAINLVSNSRLHAELPKWRGNEWVESSEIGCRGSDIKDPRPVHYGTSEEVRRLPWSLRHYRSLASILSNKPWEWKRRPHVRWSEVFSPLGRGAERWNVSKFTFNIAKQCPLPIFPDSPTVANINPLCECPWFQVPAATQ